MPELESRQSSTQPNKLNETLLNGATEVVCFRFQGRNALASVAGLGLDEGEMAGLPPSAFVARNCETGGETRGRVF